MSRLWASTCWTEKSTAVFAIFIINKMVSSSEEMIKLVDENNEEMGSVKRKYARRLNLWHRASYIFIRNTSKQFLVQKRTMQKDYCPGYFDLVTGGVVGAGEDDDESASRELAEELGVQLDLKPCNIGTFKFEDSTNRVWGNLYFVDNFSSKLTLQASEVDSIHLWTEKDIEFNIHLVEVKSDDCKITPDSIMAYRELLSRVSLE
jgi:isopentenyldiphosphate isomerase